MKIYSATKNSKQDYRDSNSNTTVKNSREIQAALLAINRHKIRKIYRNCTCATAKPDSYSMRRK